MENYNIQSAIGGGVASWRTSVSAVTGFRTDLARGITAAQVPYSAVIADTTVVTNLSAGSVFSVLTATTTPK